MSRPPKTAALVPLDQKEQEVEAIRADIAALERADLDIVEASNRFADEDEWDFEALSGLGKAELAKRGWTKRTLKIARYALLPKSEVPWGMQAAHERQLSRTRRQHEDAGGARIYATINIPAPAPRRDDRDVIVVEAETKKKP